MTHDEADPAAQESGPEEILRVIDRQRAAVAAGPAEQEGEPYLGFHLGREVYGLPLRHLREVSRLTRLRRIPGAAVGVAGLVHLRGEIICALDIRAILGSRRGRRRIRRS